MATAGLIYSTIRDIDVEALLVRDANVACTLEPETIFLVYLPAGVDLSDAFVPK